MLNSISDLKNILNDKHFKRLFVLCGKNSFSSSGAKVCFDETPGKKIIKYYYKENNLPEINELIFIVKELKKFKPDLILAVGGGAIIDYAKIANVVDLKSDLKNLIKNYSYPYKKKLTKLIVVPTTAGSGAEVTSNAVIYLDGIKYSFESELLIPDSHLLIPEFLMSGSKKIKASAGFDAIAQALESLISKKSNLKSVEYATNSLNISLNSYVSFVLDPNKKNASEMCLAANLAGKAINISKTTTPHAVSYPFSSLYGLSHGHAVSLFFESFFRYNFENLNQSDASFNLKERYETIFKTFKVKNINEFNSKIYNFKKKAGLNSSLKELNIDFLNNSEKILSGINVLRLGNNPVPISREEIYKIILKNKNN